MARTWSLVAKLRQSFEWQTNTYATSMREYMYQEKKTSQIFSRDLSTLQAQALKSWFWELIKRSHLIVVQSSSPGFSTLSCFNQFLADTSFSGIRKKQVCNAF